MLSAPNPPWPHNRLSYLASGGVCHLQTRCGMDLTVAWRGERRMRQLRRGDPITFQMARLCLLATLALIANACIDGSVAIGGRSSECSDLCTPCHILHFLTATISCLSTASVIATARSV